MNKILTTLAILFLKLANKCLEIRDGKKGQLELKHKMIRESNIPAPKGGSRPVLSKCCGAEVRLNRENPKRGDTVYYICNECDEPCDIK